uniref:Uncharacterized protein n=1 Tax=Phenylobacterium glaciei TaxID=2803784 RepID=A0A974SA45_9CAUL|nr:hypothetical protein JKL49_11455 [Phenylobacterium glaciei]
MNAETATFLVALSGAVVSNVSDVLAVGLTVVQAPSIKANPKLSKVNDRIRLPF